MVWISSITNTVLLITQTHLHIHTRHPHTQTHSQQQCLYRTTLMLLSITYFCFFFIFFPYFIFYILFLLHFHYLDFIPLHIISMNLRLTVVVSRTIYKIGIFSILKNICFRRYSPVVLGLLWCSGLLLCVLEPKRSPVTLFLW